MKTQFEAHTQTMRLVIPGDVLSTNVDQLRQAIATAVANGVPGQKWETLEFDLRTAKMIDSAGLNLLVSIVRQIEPTGRKLRALIMNPNIHRTLLFTRLDKHMELKLLPPPAA